MTISTSVGRVITPPVRCRPPATAPVMSYRSRTLDSGSIS